MAQAFFAYHRQEAHNVELKDKFLKLRICRNNYCHSLYRKDCINHDQLIDLLELIHRCDFNELTNLGNDLKNIPYDGLNLDNLKSKISQKAIVPYFRRRTITDLSKNSNISLQGLTRKELIDRNNWLAKGRRLIRKHFKMGLIDEERKELLKNSSLGIRTSKDAEEWYESILEGTFDKKKDKVIPFCEQCPHCQALQQSALKAFIKNESSEDEVGEDEVGEDEADLADEAIEDYEDGEDEEVEE